MLLGAPDVDNFSHDEEKLPFLASNSQNGAARNFPGLN